MACYQDLGRTATMFRMGAKYCCSLCDSNLLASCSADDRVNDECYGDAMPSDRRPMFVGSWHALTFRLPYTAKPRSPGMAERDNALHFLLSSVGGLDSQEDNSSYASPKS
jgi:hypothetical protein